MNKPPGVLLPDRPTHIIRFFGDDWEEPITALCGAANNHDNYLTHREMYGLDLADDNEILIGSGELSGYRKTICPDCENHPDLALFLLGDI